MPTLSILYRILSMSQLKNQNNFDNLRVFPGLGSCLNKKEMLCFSCAKNKPPSNFISDYNR